MLTLGNPNPQMQVPALDENGAHTGEKISIPAPHLNVSTTEVSMREGYDDPDEVDLALSTNNDRMLSAIGRALPKELRSKAIGVLEVDNLLATHSAGEAPDWVDSDDDPDLAKAVAHYYGCHLGQPTALITNGGRDMLHKQHLDTAAQPASANYMAVSANSSAEAATNTTLPGEITTAGGGLLRAQATFAHTNGTNTSTLTKTFTANGSDSLPVVIAKIGILNASSAGTLAYEKLISSTATLTTSGDNVAITWTFTA